MTNEKNPSIYYDRSTIGSSEELDEYGVWVKSEPQDLSSAGIDTQETFSRDFPQVPKDMEDLADFNLSVTEETASFDDVFSGEDPLLNDDFGFSSEEPDDSIAEDEEDAVDDTEDGSEDTPEDASEDMSFEEDGFEDDTDAFAGVDIGDFPLDESLLDDSPGGEEPSFRRGRLDVPVKQKAPKPSAPVQGVELSTQLLMKIADELASIKSELFSLKKELRQANLAEAAGEEEEDDGASGGFFDEEEDEKIALTGDELDNILHTADFTEETGEDATGGLSAGDTEVSGDSLPVFDESVFNMSLDDSPDAEDTAEASPDSIPVFDESVFNMSLDDSPEITLDETPEIALDDSPELERLREEGVELMTPAPEDTSFLEEELQENPVEEPPLENISLELDMEDDQDFPSPEEADTSPESAEDIEDIELSLDDFDDTDINDENTPEEMELSPEQDAETAEISLTADALTADALFEEAVDGSPEDDDTFAQVIPEGFVVEPEDAFTLDDSLDIEEVPDATIQLDSIPEIDDATMAEPELAEEQVGAESTETESSIAFPDDFALEPSDSGFQVSSESAEVDVSAIPAPIKNELRSVLSYMDQLLESLPEEKIEEFAKSAYFDTYKKLFEDLGLV